MYKIDWPDGQVLVIQFEHHFQGEFRHRKGKPNSKYFSRVVGSEIIEQRDATLCTIRKGNLSLKLEEYPIIVEAFSILHPNDNYCKKTGRKHALKRAFLFWKFKREISSRDFEPFPSKDLRTKIWNMINGREQ